AGGDTNQIIATIQVNEALSDRRTPAQIAGKALAHHRSQAFGNFGDSPWLKRPQRFLLVKAFVPNAGLEGDLLASLPANEISPHAIELVPHPPAAPLVLRFG